MKLSDYFSDNSSIATIALLCATKGITMPETEAQQIENLLSENKKFFIFISKKGIDILQMRERSVLLGKLVCQRAKYTTTLYFHDGSIREITRENMLQTWKMIVPHVTEKNDKIPVPIRKQTLFDQGMPERPKHKPYKGGFLRTFAIDQSINALSFK